MKQPQFSFRGYLIACGVAALLLVIINIGAAAVGGWVDTLSAMQAPGMLAAAVVFREGVHSDSPFMYLAGAFVVNTLLYAWPVMWLWKTIKGKDRGEF